jgi:predicted PurR-regulated permease PerM
MEDAMTTNGSPSPAAARIDSHQYERYALLLAVALLVLGCYLVVRPFLIAFLWGEILAISTRGLYEWVLRLVKGRRKLAATLTALSLVAVLLIPIAALAINVAGEMPKLTEWVNNAMTGGLHDPPAWLSDIPLVGKRAAAWWREAAANPEQLREQLQPFWKPVKDFLVAAVSGVGVGLLQFALALVIAAILYINGERTSKAWDRIAYRLGGDTGVRQVAVVRSTVRAVFKGMLGTAAIQAVLGLIGFWIAGVPQAFVLGMGTFFLSIIPGGPIVLWLPAALWLNAQGSTGWAIFMAIWGLFIVGGSDNIIRPLLIGKGTDAPLAPIFLGVIGGLIAFGFLGLFIGPVLLMIGYNLFMEWLHREESTPAAAAAAPS